VGEPAQLGEGVADLGLGVLQRGGVVLGGTCEPGEPQREGEGDQTLLGAVVEVALQPPAFGVAPLDDPGA
jgi:hypothetical protein